VELASDKAERFFFAGEGASGDAGQTGGGRDLRGRHGKAAVGGGGCRDRLDMA
jgi:hypothetical protein